MKKLTLFLILACSFLAVGSTKTKADRPAGTPGCINYFEVHPTSWNTGWIYYYQQCWVDDVWDTPELIRMVPYVI
jgi:hypothetical protein